MPREAIDIFAGRRARTANLSIRRHTDARKAQVKIERCRQRFVMCIGNESSRGSVPSAFIPRSITGRAAALGGRVQAQNGRTRTPTLVERPGANGGCNK